MLWLNININDCRHHANSASWTQCWSSSGEELSSSASHFSLQRWLYQHLLYWITQQTLNNVLKLDKSSSIQFTELHQSEPFHLHRGAEVNTERSAQPNESLWKHLSSPHFTTASIVIADMKRMTMNGHSFK